MLLLTGPHSDYTSFPSFYAYVQLYSLFVYLDWCRRSKGGRYCNTLLTGVYKAKVTFLAKVSIHTTLLRYLFDESKFLCHVLPASFTGAISRPRSRFRCGCFQTYSADTHAHW